MRAGIGKAQDLGFVVFKIQTHMLHPHLLDRNDGIQRQVKALYVFKAFLQLFFGGLDQKSFGLKEEVGNAHKTQSQRGVRNLLGFQRDNLPIFGIAVTD